MHQSSEFQTTPPDMPQTVRNVLEKLNLHSMATVEEIRETISEPLLAVQLTDQEENDLVNYYGVSPAGLGLFESKVDVITDPEIAAKLRAKLAIIEKETLIRMRKKKIAQDPETAAKKERVIADLRSIDQKGDQGKGRVQRLIDALNELNRQ